MKAMRKGREERVARMQEKQKEERQRQMESEFRSRRATEEMLRLFSAGMEFDVGAPLKWFFRMWFDKDDGRVQVLAGADSVIQAFQAEAMQAILDDNADEQVIARATLAARIKYQERGEVKEPLKVVLSAGWKQKLWR